MSDYYGASSVPSLTADEAAEVDRMVAEDLALQPIQIAENAGRNVAHLARIRFMGGDPRDHRVVVLAGAGMHGAAAIACARRLATWGADVVAYLTLGEHGYSGVMGRQVEALPQFGVSLMNVDGTPDQAWVLAACGSQFGSIIGAERHRFGASKFKGNRRGDLGRDRFEPVIASWLEFIPENAGGQ